MKQYESRINDQIDYEKAVVNNTYFQKHDAQNDRNKERQRQVDEFQKVVRERYMQQVDQPLKDKMMKESYLHLKNQYEVD